VNDEIYYIVCHRCKEVIPFFISVLPEGFCGLVSVTDEIMKFLTKHYRRGCIDADAIRILSEKQFRKLSAKEYKLFRSNKEAKEE